MNSEEINAEFEYRVAERLAILIQGTREPTKHELETAREEAFRAIERIKNEQQTNG